MRNQKILKVQDLEVYQLAFQSAMEIFEITKSFPMAEKYSLTDQVRRSSRSVCANLSEAWRKRRYRAVFINKLTDASQEAAETQTWLEFAQACGYLNQETQQRMNQGYELIFAMLYKMEQKAESFCHG